MAETLPLVDTIDLSTVPPGGKRAFDLRVATLGDGGVMRLPVNVAAGHGDGPCLAVVAGVHGDEADGIATLMELWARVDAARLSGRLIMVPVANPTAFIAGRRRSPLDDLDLNRTFPGDPEGMPTQQLAHALLTKVLKQSDFVFSLHGWYSTGTTLPYVEYAGSELRTAAASYRASVAAGFDMIWDCPWPEGLMTLAANREGIPGIEAEVGGMGTTTAEYRKRYKSYVQNLMRHLGMVPGDACPAAALRHVEGIDISSPVGGLLDLAVEIGAAVETEYLLARVLDFHGAVTHEIRAPSAGLIGGIRTFASVGAGDNVFRLLRDAARPPR